MCGEPCELECLTRRKNDGAGYLLTRCADYCLGSLALAPDDIDVFAFNARPLLPGWTGLSQPHAAASFDLFDPFGERALFVSHHLAHAFAAFWASGWTSAAVLVCDGSGGATVGAPDLMLDGPRCARTSAPTSSTGHHRCTSHLCIAFTRAASSSSTAGSRAR